MADGDLLLVDLDAEDRSIVLDLLRRHHDYTGSTVAAELLADADATCARFVKVLPRRFAAVSAALADAAQEGLDAGSPDVWSTILEVSNG